MTQFTSQARNAIRVIALFTAASMSVLGFLAFQAARTPSSPQLWANVVIAAIVIALMFAGLVLGVLDVQQNIIGRLIADDVTLLESLAGQVAITLQYARSFEQSRSQIELDSLVNVIGEKIQRTTTMKDTLQTAIGASRVRASLGTATSDVPTEPILPAEPLVAIVEGAENALDTETTPAG